MIMIIINMSTNGCLQLLRAYSLLPTDSLSVTGLISEVREEVSLVLGLPGFHPYTRGVTDLKPYREFESLHTRH